ncbi:MAG: [protein-PII] uridylyltransferase [Gammaproteobacteria bacterium]|nr:[protein-PII] uridylyltransferase [Gammaproteobacteria bacterium]
MLDIPALSNAFQQDNTIKLFRTALHDAHETLAQRFHSGTPVDELVHHRAQLIDQLLACIWDHFIGNDEQLTLVAVGGYGRGELHPRSDIDILILCKKNLPDAHKEPIEHFITFLWDIGLEVGQSVRSVDECVAQAGKEITIATNLMEARLISGAESLYQAMRDATGPGKLWPSRDFFTAKWAEQIARHEKFNDAISNLEPNIKEGPGGLRDIQMIGWVAKRHFGTDTLFGLIERGFLTENEYQTLTEDQNFLWKIRFCLHLISARKEERLLFEHQRELASQLGYQDSEHHLAVERFMKDYYRTVTALTRLNEMLLQLFREAILCADERATITPLNKRFQVRNDYIETTHDDVFSHYPFALLEIFLLLEQHQEIRGVTAATIRRIRNHLHLINDAFRNDLSCRGLFMEILRQPQGITHQLRRMNRFGVLAAYLPAFGKIVGLMQFDLFHVYTVDEHTLMVIRNVRRFSIQRHAHEFPLCNKIHSTLPKPETLYIAALFHDIAKGRGGDHAALGAADTVSFCADHSMSQYDTGLVAWLVKNHLLMSSTAQRKDISDPDVINLFAETVGDALHLDYLFLLTIADIQGTSPTLLTDWKRSLLCDLYHATRRALKNQMSETRHVASIKTAARALLAEQGFCATLIASLWESWGDDYFLRHSPKEIAWHTQSIARSNDDEQPLIEVRQDTERGGVEVFVYAKEYPGLFTQTVATFDQIGLSIADARIITATNGHTLNSYMVHEESSNAADAERCAEIVAQLKQQLSPSSPLPLPVKRRQQRRVRCFSTPTKVTFGLDERNQRTIVELTASDRPGLLTCVGKALLHCDTHLQNAKITTFGSHVEDVFFITDASNQPLRSEEQFDCVRSTIKQYLDENQQC